MNSDSDRPVTSSDSDSDSLSSGSTGILTSISLCQHTHTDHITAQDGSCEVCRQVYVLLQSQRRLSAPCLSSHISSFGLFILNAHISLITTEEKEKLPHFSAAPSYSNTRDIKYSTGIPTDFYCFLPITLNIM